MPDDETRELHRKTIHEVVVSREPEIQARFLSHFDDQLTAFLSEAAETYGMVLGMKERGVPANHRTALSEHYLFMALNSVVVAFRLVTSGLIIPAGCQARHFGEAVAMSLLIAHPQLDEFENFQRAPGRYPVHTALNRANRRKTRRILDLDQAGWASLLKIQKFFDKLSHASAFSFAATANLSVSGGRFLGAGFDPDKVDFYSGQLSLFISGCEVLRDVVPRVEELLKSAGSGVVSD